jgi:PilZ domain
VTTPESERRKHQRLKIKVPIEIYTEDTTSPIRGATSDLSLSGCYVETIFPFLVGTQLEIKLQLEGTLLVVGTVVTSDPQVGNGVHFTRMLPEDIEELRAFLEAAEKKQ